MDEDGNILVPKDVRPIIEYEKTYLGTGRGAIRQYRYKNLHIREYRDHYSVHSDRVDPRLDPLGHLLVDAPEYLVPLAIAVSYLKTIKKCSSRRTSEMKRQSINYLHKGIA
jgi:hypothetical protein